MSKGQTRAAVALILAAVAALFCASFGKFFCGDSLYFFSHAITSASEVARLFTTLDDLSTYRPLPTVLFSFVLEPEFGFHPLPYHVFELGMHLATSLLVFFLVRRLTRSDAAALVGLVFFGAQSTGFYLSYDATFLPDSTAGLLSVTAFLLFAYGRRTASLVPMVLALFCKESAVAIPVGFAAIALIQAADEGGEEISALRKVIPAAVSTVFYLVFQCYLHNGWVYPSDKSAYRFSFGPDNLYLKAKYLPWLLNVPSDWFRQRAGMIPATVLMLPPLIWLAIRVWRTRNREAVTLVACGVWAFAALAPAIPVAQVPMKHNLYMPLVAAAVAIARCVSHAQIKASRWLLAVCFVAATAFHVRQDLRSSWVAEGSDITEASLAAVKRAYPVLSRGAQFYILPARIPGGIAWYFDDESLFRRAYNEPRLRVYYAGLNRLPPAGFERGSRVLVFAYYSGRLYDVTADYKRALLRSGQDLLPGPSGPDSPAYSRAQVESKLQWPADELIDGHAAAAVPQAIGDSLRESVVMLPQTTVRIPVDTPLPAGAELLVGSAHAGQQPSASIGAIAWESGGQRHELTRVFIEERDGAAWFDDAQDLSRFAGQTGTLVLENAGARDGGWIAWNRLRIVPKSAQEVAVEDRSHPWIEVSNSLLSSFPQAEVSSSIPWTAAELPDGRAASLRNDSIEVLPSTTVRIPVTTPIPPGSLLGTYARTVGKQRAAALGRIAWEGPGQRQELARILLDPGEDWFATQDLSAVAGQTGTLVLENLGGRGSDWIAWNGLHIVSKSGLTPVAKFMPLANFAEARVATTVAWDQADLQHGEAAGLQLLSRGGESREAMLVSPSTTVRFPVTIPANGRLRFKFALGPGHGGAAETSVSLATAAGLAPLLHDVLDSDSDADDWWQADVDLAALLGKSAAQSGELVFRNDSPRSCRMAAWSDIELLSPSAEQAPKPGNPRPISLIALLDPQKISFDRRERYPSYDKFDTPSGAPAFLWCDSPARPSRFALVTIAGARVRYDFSALPPHSYLSLGVAHGTGVGDGVEARVFWQDTDGRREIYQRLVAPSMHDWDDAIIPLPPSSAGGGSLTIEAGSGPKGNTIGDWLAWSRLRIIDH